MQPSLQDRLAALKAMSATQLRAEWQKVHKAAPPPISADLLARGIAWRLQERMYGGFTPAALRALQRQKQELGASGSVSINVYEGRIKLGTRLVRDWGGRSHHVLVVEGGYDYLGQRYASLTQIARAITGADWSGPRFFGLKQRRRSS